MCNSLDYITFSNEKIIEALSWEIATPFAACLSKSNHDINGQEAWWLLDWIYNECPE